MKVILLTDVAKLGRKYDIKEVSSGYAANFLLPRRLAELATGAKEKHISKLQERYADERRVQEELLSKNIDALKQVHVTISGKANDKGHLFQGIHREEIAVALKDQARLDVAPESIGLEHPLKAIGEFTMSVLVGEKKGTFKLSINKEK